MSNYAEDYMQSDDAGKMEMLQVMYNMKGTTKEERAILAQAAQKIYNRMRGRGPYSILDNISNPETQIW